jgi:hypothetical protein
MVLPSFAVVAVVPLPGPAHPVPLTAVVGSDYFPAEA